MQRSRNWLGLVLLLLCFLCLALQPASAQSSIGNKVDQGPTLPTTCNVGQVYFQTTTATVGLYQCAVANTWTLSGGGFAFTGVLASIPATCSVGQLAFITNATAGQNIYECAATNTWTQQLNSGAGGASTALDNLASVSINLALTPQTGIDLGSTTKPFRNLYLFGAGTFGTTYFKFGGTPTAARQVTLPDADSVTVVADTGAANNFLTAISAAGAISKAQPSFANLSGSVAAGQMPALTGAITTVAGAVATSPGKADLLDAVNFCSDAGANDTYTCSLSPAITAYVTGNHYRIKANTANTGAATINLNSLGAKTIVKVTGGITTTLADNDIRAGQWADLVYDGTNMQLQSTLGNAASGSGTVTVVGAGSLTSTALVTGGGTQTVQTPSATATMDTSGNISTPGSITSGSGSIGQVAITTGACPAGVASTSSVCSDTGDVPKLRRGTAAAIEIVDLSTSQTLTNKSIAASEINSGTLAVAQGGTALASGTSGGILGYTASGTLASSVALTVNVLPKGGGAGATPTNSLATDNATTLTYTGTGGVSAPLLIATGATAGGTVYTAGSTNGHATASTVTHQAPASVTAYDELDPGVAAAGTRIGTVSSATITSGFSGDANHSATVTTGSGTSVPSTSLCSTTFCPAGTYRVNAYLDITTACGTSGTYSVSLVYTDDQASKQVVIPMQGAGESAGVLTTTTVTNYGQASFILRSTGAASINYLTTAVACGTAGPMVGKLYLSVEPVQ